MIGSPWAYDYRNRLTHTLEVSQVGRSLARRHDVNEALVEAACLGHDIGHPPFGHAGERALNRLMKDYGGFDANAQTLRVLLSLEVKGDGRPGLNLTRATLWSVLKYPYRREGHFPPGGPPTDAVLKAHKLERRTETELYAVSRFLYDEDLAKEVRDGRTFEDWLGDGKLDPASEPQSRLNGDPTRVLACRIMDRADDLAYAIHDFEDAALAGFITHGAINRVEEPLLEAVLKELTAEFEGDADVLKPVLEALERRVDELLGHMQKVDDPESILRPETRKWFGDLVDGVGVEVPAADPDETTTGYRVTVPRRGQVLISLLSNLGFELMIRDERVVRYLRKGAIMLERSFGELLNDPKVVDDRVGQLMPRHVARRMANMDEQQRARAVCDFLASLSEPGLARFHSTLFEASGGSPFL